MTQNNSWKKIKEEFKKEAKNIVVGFSYDEEGEEYNVDLTDENAINEILDFFHSHFNSYVESIVPEEKKVFTEEKLDELSRQDNSGINYAGLARSLQTGFNLCRQQILDNHKQNG